MWILQMKNDCLSGKPYRKEKRAAILEKEMFVR